MFWSFIADRGYKDSSKTGIVYIDDLLIASISFEEHCKQQLDLLKS